MLVLFVASDSPHKRILNNRLLGGVTNRLIHPVRGLAELSLRIQDLSHACIVRDLTLILTMDRRVRLGPIPPPFPFGKGGGVDWSDGFPKQSNLRLRKVWASPL